MTSDYRHEDPARLPGEGDVQLIPIAPSEEEVKREAEKAAENAYKLRQLLIDEKQVKVAESNRDLTRALAIFTLLGVIAGGVQSCLTKRSVDVANRSAQAAENAAYQACLGAQVARGALRETQNTEIDAHGAAIAAVYQAMAATQDQRAEVQMVLGRPTLAAGQDIAIPFNLKNAGKTAALKMSMKIRFVFINRDSEPDFRYPLRRAGVFSNNRMEPGPANQQGEPSVTAFNADESVMVASSQDVKDFSEQKKDLVLFARVVYMDIFGGYHWKQFCQPFFAERSGFVKETPHSGECAKYNNSDVGSGLVKPMPSPKISAPLPEILCTKPK